MIYIDSSALLKTLWREPESTMVIHAIAREPIVIVSSLAELETEVQLRSKWLSGAVTRRRYDNYRSTLQSFRKLSPFEFRDLSGSLFQTALRQHLSAPSHCRTLDRLHLAAMSELGVRRLLTNDGKQANAAAALNFEVVIPS